MPAHKALALGFEAFQNKEWERAYAICQEILVSEPNHSETHHLLGVLLLRTGHPERGIQHLERALEHAEISERVRLQNSLGNAYRQVGRLSEALLLFQSLAQSAPRDPEILNNLAIAFFENQQFSEALLAFERAATLAPGHWGLQQGLYKAQVQTGAFAEALLHLKHCQKRFPEHLPVILYLMGNVYLYQNQIPKALATYEKALALAPEHPDILNNQAIALHESAQFEAANMLFSQLNTPDAQMNQGMSLLLQGKYTAWSQYETPRWARERLARRFNAQEWLGEEALEQTLLVYAEQGFGDTLQFLRYLPALKPQVKELVIECQDALLPLLQPSFPEYTWVGQSQPLPPFELFTSVMHLPAIFDPNELRVVPPLQLGDYKENAHIQNIGLMWRTNRPGTDPLQHLRNRNKSMDLKALRPLFELDINWVSLQLETTAAERTLLQKYPCQDRASELSNFSDTARVLASLDALVTVDTAIAHLAGNMGLPTYLLLPHVPDWRWDLTQKSTSPWYKSLRLYRQTQPGAWNMPVMALKHDLKAVMLKGQ